MTVRLVRHGMTVLALTLVTVFAGAQSSEPKSTDSDSLTSVLKIEQNIGGKVPTKLPFRDELGAPVTLGSYLGQRPVMVVPIEIGYEGSSALINESLLRVLSKSGRQKKMRVGEDFELVLLSINPTEVPELALAEKRKLSLNIDAPTYFNPLRGAEPKRAPSQPGLEKGLHILTGSRESIVATTDALGFMFKYSAKEGVLANPLGTVFLNKDGQITGYTIGTEIITKFAESNLDDATNGRLSEKADDGQKFAIYKVSSAALKNRPIIENIIKVTGWSTLIALIGSIAYMSFKYKTPPVPTRGNDEKKTGGPQASA